MAYGKSHQWRKSLQKRVMINDIFRVGKIHLMNGLDVALLGHAIFSSLQCCLHGFRCIQSSIVQARPSNQLVKKKNVFKRSLRNFFKKNKALTLRAFRGPGQAGFAHVRATKLTAPVVTKCEQDSLPFCKSWMAKIS